MSKHMRPTRRRVSTAVLATAAMLAALVAVGLGGALAAGSAPSGAIFTTLPISRDASAPCPRASRSRPGTSTTG